MNSNRIKLFLTIPMFALAGMIFNEVVNNNCKMSIKKYTHYLLKRN